MGFSFRIVITRVTADISTAKKTTIQNLGKKPIIKERGTTQASQGNLLNINLQRPPFIVDNRDDPLIHLSTPLTIEMLLFQIIFQG